MATPRPYGDGWRVQVYVKGQRDSATFASKREASTWAARRTLELQEQAQGKAGLRKTLGDALRRFGQEVAPTHKGHRWELVRLAMLEADPHFPARLPIGQVTAAQLNDWKAQRLKAVSAGSVIREMSLLSSVLGYARRDWGWIERNPLADVRRPPAPKHRERVITWAETRLMLRTLGYRPGKRPQSLQQVIGYLFALSLRTGMRQGELLGLQWPQVHGAWVELPETKNGTMRHVPLSTKAQRLMRGLAGQDKPLPVMSATADALFRKARHTAATRIGRTVGQPGRLSFPEFCKVFGWRDPKHALVYVNPSAAELAGKM